MICHICKKEAKYECEDCDLPVCDGCTTPFTIHNQIQYTQCLQCGEFLEKLRADE
jgi:hypothetical protein